MDAWSVNLLKCLPRAANSGRAIALDNIMTDKDTPATGPPETTPQIPYSRQIECIILDYIKYPEERKAQHIKWLLSKGYRVE